ncbi:ovochymase-2-like [Mya arenaria]|uniref:ovochymase-2-like n=1 Tax=Mya arenaria TaxID=6604 RepID=UPI0022E157F2|nr:ovochymase-2-like [Mya arenaria]
MVSINIKHSGDLVAYALYVFIAGFVSTAGTTVRPGAARAQNHAEGNASRYIVGGDPTYQGEFPHHVAILLDDEFVCGGTILDEFHVLTTAYCLFPNGLANGVYKVFAGVWRPDQPDPVAQQWTVEDYVVHSQFDVNDYASSDIAVLRIGYGFTFNKYVGPAAIPRTREEEQKVRHIGDCAVVGYGRTNEAKEKYPNKLRKIEGLFLRNFKTCNSALRKSGAGGMSRTQMCSINPPKNVCVGDGGGALVCRKPNTGDQLVVGVTSFILSPCRTTGTAYYMRAYRFRQFIQRAIAKMDNRA